MPAGHTKPEASCYSRAEATPPQLAPAHLFTSNSAPLTGLLSSSCHLATSGCSRHLRSNVRAPALACYHVSDPEPAVTDHCYVVFRPKFQERRFCHQLSKGWVIYAPPVCCMGRGEGWSRAWHVIYRLDILADPCKSKILCMRDGKARQQVISNIHIYKNYKSLSPYLPPKR